MILYANGCSHTAAAEAVVPECFAVDDGRHGIDRRPHPSNLAASWCSHVARDLSMQLICQAESGGSNPRILRTAREWLARNQNQKNMVLMILQWTTWEREEWYHQGVWYQVNASGADWVPADLRVQYKQYINDVDWTAKTNQAHKDIWQLHLDLLAQGVRHLFFSGHSTFSDIQNRLDWGPYYVQPYDRQGSYHNWLLQNGGTYANPKSYHFDAASHRLWAEYMLQYINRNQILAPTNEISADR